MGLGICLIILSVILVFSQFIMIISSLIKDTHDTSFVFAIMGRFLLGITREGTDICRLVILNNWFIGQEYAFAFGISTSFSRIGTVINELTTPSLADKSI